MNLSKFKAGDYVQQFGRKVYLILTDTGGVWKLIDMNGYKSSWNAENNGGFEGEAANDFLG